MINPKGTLVEIIMHHENEKNKEDDDPKMRSTLKDEEEQHKASGSSSAYKSQQPEKKIANFSQNSSQPMTARGRESRQPQFIELSVCHATDTKPH